MWIIGQAQSTAKKKRVFLYLGDPCSHEKGLQGQYPKVETPPFQVIRGEDPTFSGYKRGEMPSRDSHLPTQTPLLRNWIITFPATFPFKLIFTPDPYSKSLWTLLP